MKHKGLKGETEGLISAAQDQALNTRNYSKHIIKQGTTDRCKMCHTQPETVEHIISGCQTLAADQYLNRHNEVAAQLHLDICRYYGINVEAECWYQHKPEEVMEMKRQLSCGTPQSSLTDMSPTINQTQPYRRRSLIGAKS